MALYCVSLSERISTPVLPSVNNVWCIKFRSKHSSNTVLCLLRNLMHQTLCIDVSMIFKYLFSLNLWDLISNVYFQTLFAQNQTFWFLCEQSLKCSHSLGTLGKKLVTVQLLFLDIAKYINSEATASYNSIADKIYGYFLTILAGTHKNVKMFLESNSIF